MEHVKQQLEEGLVALGLSATPAQSLLDFSTLLLEKNKVMNLTAITEPSEVVTKHLLDCAVLCSHYDFSGKTAIDVGCGAGFPGLPVKLCCPDLEVVLLDSLRKRIDFIRECTTALGLSGAEPVHARAEEYKKLGHFDFAFSRAVAPLNVLCELCLPFVKIGGRFLAMKSTNSDEEIQNAHRAIAILGGKLSKVLDYTIPGSDIVHRIVEIEKIKETPKAYPRRFQKISAQPL